MSCGPNVAPMEALLGKGEVGPVEILNGDSIFPVVLVCEHAGRAIPAALGDLGLSPEDLQAHIAWDIGAEKVARLVAAQLNAPLILQRYSRLVVDCNRPPHSENAMPPISDGILVPANNDLSPPQRQSRIAEVFTPFQDAVSTQIRRPSCAMVLSIHSYTRTMAGHKRPWDVGFLYRKHSQTSQDLAVEFGAFVAPEKIGLNQPYQIDDEFDWFVPMHGEANGLPHSLIEICNDLIATADGQQKWADWLACAITRSLKKDHS